jgi:quercetin dioxygenase-like cupin family protein
MISKMLWAALYACLLIGSALAQDPTKVEPTHYRLAFENEYVQVVNIHYGPHEKSALHNHPGGVVVVLTSGHLKFTDEKGKTQEVYAKPGECRWFPAFKHTVENLGDGDTDYNARYIAIKSKARDTRDTRNTPNTAQSPMDAENGKLRQEYILAAMKQ